MPPAAYAFRRFAPWAWTLVALTFCLIVLGAITRLMGAGLSCPDWPMCNGQWIPTFEGGVFFEWFHRLVAATVSTLFLVEFAWIMIVRPLRQRLWGFAALCVALLAVQITLGALTVTELLRAWTVTMHLGTGTALFAMFLTIALMTHREAYGLWRGESSSSALRVMTLGCLAASFLQILLGGLVASHYASWACPDWPTCQGAWFPPMVGTVGLHMAHRLGAYGLLAMLGGLWSLGRGASHRVRRLSTVALGVGLAQGVLGVANVLMGIPVGVSAAHNALAVALLAALVMLAFVLLSAPGRSGQAWQAVAR